MSIENPVPPTGEENEQKPNYILKGKPYFSVDADRDLHPITMTHGASTEQTIADMVEKKNKDKNEDLFEYFLNQASTYSETYKILPNGTFDKEKRLDGLPPLLDDNVNTPDDLYQFMSEIQAAHPEYKFDFERNPEGQWLKYTVSKN